MTTREFYEEKAIESGYDDFLHWIDCYDYELQPQKIVEWTDGLIKKLNVPVVCGSLVCKHVFKEIKRPGAMPYDKCVKCGYNLY